MERRLFGKYKLFKDEPEIETLKADYVSKAVDELLHDMTGKGIIPDWETMQIIVKEGFNIISGPDWYEEEKEYYKGPYVGWVMTVGIKFYSENYPNTASTLCNPCPYEYNCTKCKEETDKLARKSHKKKKKRNNSLK